MQPDHFGSLSNVFEIMQKAYKRDGELHLKSVIKDLGIEHIALINTIRESVISEHRTEWLVNQLRKQKQRKILIELGDRLKLVASNNGEPDQVIGYLKDHLSELLRSDFVVSIDPVRDYNEFVEKVILSKNVTHSGLITGLIDLDAITGGWQKQDLIVIGGRTSMGKTAFALNNILSLAQNGQKCLYFSLEMSKHQMYSRLASSAYQVNLRHFRSGQVTDEVIEKLEKREDWWKNILIDDTRAVTADYIADKMYEVKQQFGLDLVVVDYLQDIKEIGETNDHQGSALARICRKLRKAAQECDVPVLAMSQIVRDVEKRNDKRPNNSDLSGSTGIETSADLIILLYRDEYYDPNTKEPNIIELLITKHRNGSLGLVKLFYDKQTQRIKPLSEIGFTTSHPRVVSSKKANFRTID